MHPIALLESYADSPFGRSFRFDGFDSIISASSSDQVAPALAAVEQATEHGLHAVGFVAYEAAPGLNPHLVTKQKNGVPLVWFALFRERIEVQAPRETQDAASPVLGERILDMEKSDYHLALGKIRAAIAAGETYQVNFTARQRFSPHMDLFGLYRSMCRNQQAPFCAWLDTGGHRILSASPELFFSLRGRTITMQPMKGTAARDSDAGLDTRLRERLAGDPKELAENLMIVDLVRNDLGTIAETGSVAVPALFEVESYPTVHQMTSTVTATLRPDVGLTDIFRALFPCGSVTGAPKRRTMEIIRDLETSPRGVYCGAIGYLSPGADAVFSVAIRTAVADMATGRAEIGIGSGITWDSRAESEFNECMIKSSFMTQEAPSFQLIETLRHDQSGYLLLDRHIERLGTSAAYFGFRFDDHGARDRLAALGSTLHGIHKVRLLLKRDGAIDLEAHQLPTVPPGEEPALVAVSEHRVAANDPFLRHKTTRRRLYDQELGAHPDCYDVILVNERDEVTEGCFNTLVVSKDGELLTPPLECGLLPGVLREELLAVGAVREAVMTIADLRAADRLWLVNSVRGWRECTIMPPFEKGELGGI